MKLPGSRNWDAVAARLEVIRESLERSHIPAPDEIARIRRERASRYAKREEESAAQIKEGQLVVFRLGADRYALPSGIVREVLLQPRITLVPFAPASVAGVMQVRGDILPVYSLRNKLEPSATPGERSGAVIVVRLDRRHAGLLVDEVDEIRMAGTEYRKQEGQSAHIAWLTDDLVGVLDPQTLALPVHDGEPQWKGES